jgi:hypothetical protein
LGYTLFRHQLACELADALCPCAQGVFPGFHHHEKAANKIYSVNAFWRSQMKAKFNRFLFDLKFADFTPNLLNIFIFHAV